MKWKFVIALKDIKVIEELEKKYNIIIPEKLKECIKYNNAGYPERGVYDTIDNKERVFKNLLSYNKEDEENIYEYTDMLEKKLIPFGLDPFGNILFIKNQEVKLFLLELEEEEIVASSFEEFLEKLY